MVFIKDGDHYHQCLSESNTVLSTYLSGLQQNRHSYSCHSVAISMHPSILPVSWTPLAVKKKKKGYAITV